MKYLKPLAYIVAALFLIGIAWKFFAPKPIIETVTHHQDTTIADTHQSTIRPTSLPFEHETVPPVVLPPSINSNNIAKVDVIVSNHNGKQDTIVVITDKQGNQSVPKQPGSVTEFHEYNYLPPYIAFGINPKIGVDGNTTRISPVVAISFLEIMGRVQLPVFALDLHGIGIGADCKIFNPISLGVLYCAEWNTNKQIRLSLVYNF